MVVALDAYRHRDAVTGVNNAGIFSRTDQHVGRFARQTTQVHPGRLVRTVLTPHHAVERKFEMVRFAAQDGTNVFELCVGQAEGTMQGFGDATHTNKLLGVDIYEQLPRHQKRLGGRHASFLRQ
jgi:hypothetical protein